MLKPGDHESKVFHPFNVMFTWLTKRFLGAVGFALRQRFISLLVFFGVIGLVVLLFMRIPGSFIPSEDQGYIFSSIQLPDGATLERTGKTGALLQTSVQPIPAVDHMFVVAGFDLIGGGNKTNAGTSFIPLKHWDERRMTGPQLAVEVSRLGSQLPDGIAFAFNPPPIRGLGTASGFEVYVQARNDPDTRKLSVVVNDFMAALGKDPQLTGINTFFRPNVPQLLVEVDRERAISLGVPINDVFDALQSTMGPLYVNDFNKFGRTYRVQVQADAPYRSRPEDLGNVYVRSSTGEMIPLKAFLQTKNVVGPEQLERFQGFVAAKILGSGKPGISSGEAIKAVEQVAAQTLPAGYAIAWTGQAYQEKRTGTASVFAFGFAILMVYLILSALYERWRLPAAVVLAVPFAVLGALTFVFFRGMENDIYFQIGLVVLIGLAAKNAILIVEFAQQAVLLEGKTPVEAALQAARLRFRPIVMTSLAFVLGVVPLVFASGAGAAARKSMGTGVFGGMIVATFVATIFIPLFFAFMSRKDQKPIAGTERRERSEPGAIAPAAPPTTGEAR